MYDIVKKFAGRIVDVVKECLTRDSVKIARKPTFARGVSSDRYVGPLWR
ncbi:hypothetical protein EV589_3104 [Mycobacterium sp. BK558]|uniref:Uncharacterized protein n=1 Tax=Mycolicibacterium chlorophenolicum TaxID=37916 RepID=A0A0J6VRF5_9MYCO|nr:hypothetical protein MCHLDSM_04187 [Mycolicibacterium chlorophenolicum]RZT18843.1 hypothetical protein EV589_3104 [Mycobacterium sp. BK558]